MDWTGYTVHDAANILRRYFNKLPEPIIPLEFYQKFRNPLRNHQAQAVGAIETQSPSEGEFDHEGAIRAYQGLITELPPLNRQLLLYILDLLAVFASKSDLNKMTTPNLAAIFQPGILNHPQHDMAPQEYRLSQDVLIFLIENQDSFLIGMQGTEADPETVRDVQSGTPAKSPSTPTTPTRSKTVIGRSGSNSSVAAESVRKWGSIRRNVSVSSKHSKRSDKVAPPGSPVTTPPVPVGGGVHRSNTVPSRRGGSSTHSPRFPRDKHSDPSSPSSGSPTVFPVTTNTKLDRPAVGLAVISPTLDRSSSAERNGSLQSTPIATQAPQTLLSTTTSFPAAAFPTEITPASATSSEATTPLATVVSGTSAATITDHQTARRDTTPLLAPARISIDKTPTDRSASNTSSNASGRKFLDILKPSPISDGEGRKPNKLQKKRIPGSSLSSAHSSAQSLNDPHERHGDFSPQSPISPTHATIAEVQNDSAYDITPSHVSQNIPATPQRYPTESTLRPTVSPSNSFHSHTDTSDADMVGDDMPTQDSDQPERKKRNRWRFSRTQNKLEQPSTPGSGNPLGTMSAREQAMSRSTIGSGGSQPRHSFQEHTPLAYVANDHAAGLSPEARPVQPAATSDMVFSDSERERGRGPMSWLRNKIQERKEKDAEKRSQTPERGLHSTPEKSYHSRSKSRTDLQDPGHSMAGTPTAANRNRSLEQPRSSFEGKHTNVAAVATHVNHPPETSVAEVIKPPPSAESTDSGHSVQTVKPKQNVQPNGETLETHEVQKAAEPTRTVLETKVEGSSSQ